MPKPRRRRGDGCVYRRGSVWWIKFAADGRTHRESSRSPHEPDARSLLRRRLAEATTGQHRPAAARVTLNDLVCAVEDDYRANGRRSLRRMLQAAAHLRAHFGNSRAQDISSLRIAAYVTARRDCGAAAATVANELAVLRRGFTLAVRAELLVAKPAFPALRVNNARRGFVEENEFRALLAELPADLRAPITFAFFTGWRLTSEVLPLQWSRVDLAAGVARLEPGTTKSGEGREWPIAALPELRDLLAAQDALRRALESETGRTITHVFHRAGAPIKSLRGAWAGACRRAGIVGRIPHDCRRSAVRALERAGVSRSVAIAAASREQQAGGRRSGTR